MGWVTIIPILESFYGKDIVSVDDFRPRERLDCLHNLSYHIEQALQGNRFNNVYSQLVKGRILATLFFEPSTRTRLSFEAAMYRLGGNCIGFAESKTSSVEKGENIPDTVRTVEKYADAIVMRHSLEGSARVAADSVNIPVINAGTGAEEHPTQALLDTYTMRRELAKRRDKEPLINLDGINVALVGDLRYGRTVHSLARAFTLFPSITLFLVSPDSLKMRREVVEDIKDKLNVTETTNLNEILGKVDVVYMTRIQKERFEDKIEYEKIKHAFVLTPNDLKGMREDAILMHPLPRVDEIDYQVDSTKQASYFSQVENGLITRMALLAVTLTKPKNLPFSDVK